MSTPKRIWLPVVIAAVAGALLGGAGAWVVLQSRLSALEGQLTAAGVAVGQAERRVEELEAALTSSTTPAPPASSQQATPAAVEKPAPLREFAYLKKVSVADRTLIADYAQFLTGKAAADAAQKAGGESPPPNDYYIVNENPLLRTLPVSPAVAVRLTVDNEGGAVAEGFDATFADLAAQLKANPDMASYRHFWLTIEGGTVTRIEEQFTP